MEKGTETGPWKAGGTKTGQIPLWLFLHLENVHGSQYLSCKRRLATLGPRFGLPERFLVSLWKVLLACRPVLSSVMST